MHVKCFVFLLTFACVNGVIVPEELQSILSLFYSNVPPIKKGTDARFGVGYKLGDHADFQVILELGPQTETRPIGGASMPTNKRNAASGSRHTKSTKNDGAKWLRSWSRQIKTRPVLSAMRNTTEQERVKLNDKTLVSNDDTLKQLESLLGKLLADTPLGLPVISKEDIDKAITNTTQTLKDEDTKRS